MKDLAIRLENTPGALARMGKALAGAGISIEGGGAWAGDHAAVAHFLFEDGLKARKVLEANGFQVIKENEVLVQRLKQDEPGQLGKIAKRMAQAGVNIEVMYSDHYHRLILVVDDLTKGKAVSAEWRRTAHKLFNDGTNRNSIH